MAARILSRSIPRAFTHRTYFSSHSTKTISRKHSILATIINKNPTSGVVETHHTHISGDPGGNSITIDKDVGNIFKTAAEEWTRKNPDLLKTEEEAVVYHFPSDQELSLRMTDTKSEYNNLDLDDAEIPVVYDCSGRRFGLENSPLPQLVLPEDAELLPSCSEAQTVDSTLYPGVSSHAIAINGTADDEYYKAVRHLYRASTTDSPNLSPVLN
ncbi:hypothetical protein H072_879 [Dactylellina haptotyla CBS 200.50]|uniref:Uncharacterized protein n=1 Tax=Dactylellina haptotyla (strain CBS 200.50) TaxID=1284197 RepID=S8AQH1_DACHA|nr:hypothetical protein H072_879 [Dactylellina haptotyla CBS 200.50]